MRRFTVVIATHNRAALLARTLDALARQTWPRKNFEIVVADNASTDATRTVVEAAQARDGVDWVRYLFVRTPGKSFAVNEAIATSSAELLAFTDDDTRPDPRWLAQLATAFDETGADFIAGRVVPIWETPRPAWLSPALFGVIAVPDNGDRRVEIGTASDQGIMTIGANMAVARRVVERIGGLRGDLGKLDGSLRGGEDHEYFLRMRAAGFKGVYEPTAVVHHWVPSNRLSRSYFRRWFYQNGRDVAWLERSFPRSATYLFQLPRHLWREAAGNLASLVTSTASGDPVARFRAAARLFWFGGYLRQAWSTHSGVHSDESSLARGD